MLQSASCVIASSPDSQGTAEVTGAGSQWQTGSLSVGESGTAELTIRNGGHVDSSAPGSTVWLAHAGGRGTVEVSGTGSQWQINHLFVGFAGRATLNVLSAGQVNANSVSIAYGYGANAIVNVSATSSDKLVVNGAATINGGTVTVSSQNTIVGEHDYEILAAQSVAGTFATLDTALLRLSPGFPSLDYDPNSVWLHLSATSFDDLDVALTENQQQLGGALQQIADAGGNEITRALQDVTDTEQLRHDYDQLSGQTRPSLAPLTVSGTSQFLSTVSGRLRSQPTGLLSGTPDSSLFAPGGLHTGTADERMDVHLPGQSLAIGNGSDVRGDQKWGVWARGYGLRGERETEQGVPGYSYNIYGGNFGLDYQFTDQLIGGVLVGLANGDIDYDGSPDSSDLETIYGGLYGSLSRGPWYVDSAAIYASLDYDTERFVDLTAERLTGSPQGYELAAYVEAGRNCPLTPNLLLQPLASLQYAYLNIDSYTETGGISALSFDDQTFQSVQGSLGAKLTRRLGESAGGFRADAQVRGRWVHEFGDNQARVDTSFVSDPTAVFTVHDAAIARDSAVLGAGLSVDVTKQLRAYVDYDVRLNSDETIQVVGAALQYCW